MKYEEGQWKEIQLGDFDRFAAQLEVKREFSLWYTEYNTSPETTGFKEFLMEPLPVLRAAGLLRGSDAPWTVVTRITNHHKPLNPRIIFALAMVDEKDSTVHLTLHKQENNQPDGDDPQPDPT